MTTPAGTPEHALTFAIPLDDLETIVLALCHYGLAHPQAVTPVRALRALNFNATALDLELALEDRRREERGTHGQSE